MICLRCKKQWWFFIVPWTKQSWKYNFTIGCNLILEEFVAEIKETKNISHLSKEGKENKNKCYMWHKRIILKSFFLKVGETKEEVATE